MKIGVFDSGIGGKAVAHSLARDFSDAEIIYIHDREHVPYRSTYSNINDCNLRHSLYLIKRAV